MTNDMTTSSIASIQHSGAGIRWSGGKESIAMLMFGDSDMDMWTGQFAVGGIEIAMEQDTRIKFNSQAPCIAARQLPNDSDDPDKPGQVALSCVAGTDRDRSYEFSRGQATPVPIGYRVLLDMETREQVGTPGPFLYEEIKRYYDTIIALVGEEQAQCLLPYLDLDLDGIPDPSDQCIDQPGPASTNGGPDSDSDGIADKDDWCPDVFGPTSYEGCLPPTAVRLTDSDADSVVDSSDHCPRVPGLAGNQGYPIGTNP
jgi:hypothetical protein